MFYYLKTFVYFLMAISQFWDLENVFPMFLSLLILIKFYLPVKKKEYKYGGLTCNAV